MAGRSKKKEMLDIVKTKVGVTSKVDLSLQKPIEKKEEQIPQDSLKVKE